ncbi:N-acetylglucosamine-6-phosphate deacetylase [Quadrisphaera sp. DSM 44207]|uniref:N-acetylglucosamine-6-phosphate deacetylase n=1 Tax=Quadrisphaera sp. DSM 44207 TaxID=1881057 RepID=UPI000884A5CB|nr:N-acetylglucosamine-6-phosphate deacetylase [Quadrisphaera sp. DSM 44207]SDQ15446.1 N-acetylglucosamine-6-phosphate deacetylase [Quadrisphaera sp. DSM 44207]
MVEVVAAPRVHTGSAWLEPGWVRWEGERVVDVGSGQPPSRPSAELADGVLAPGLVDAQLNGAFGHDLVDADAAGWSEVLSLLPSTGTTAAVPTFITAPVEELAGALRRRAALHPGLEELPGAARAVGVHLEGPFLSSRRRGAHREHLLVDPAPEAVDALVDAAGGHLVYLTLAPERSGALDAVRRLAAAGVRVAVGHSDASEAQARAAADAGATLVTHLFNAQRPLHHRDPGVVGAALADPRFTVGLIADGHHVAPSAVAIAFAAAPGRVMLVTDATAALGMRPGRYSLGGVEVEVPADGPPVRADGTMAGSSLRMDDAVAGAVACGVDLGTALAAATRVPADALGRTDLGRLEPGSAADLVHLGPDGESSLRARATWVRGRLAWSAAPELSERR